MKPPLPSLFSFKEYPLRASLAEDFVLDLIRQHYTEVPDGLKIDKCFYSPVNIIQIDLVKGDQ